VEVFEQSHDEHVSIGDFAEYDRDSVKAGKLSGADAAFARDDDDVGVAASGNDGLEHTGGLDGFGEFLQGLFREFLAGLKGIGLEVSGMEIGYMLGAGERGFFAEERFEAFRDIGHNIPFWNNPARDILVRQEMAIKRRVPVVRIIAKEGKES
jgi:hypothetical protein